MGAPPFGRLELPPTRKCQVLEHIGGEEARLALSKLPCEPRRPPGASQPHLALPPWVASEACRRREFALTCAPIDLSTPVVAEPTIIVEVMSPSSEADDTLRKWFSSRKIPSLKHYLVLAQDRRLVQIHTRAGDLWRERFVSEGGIELEDPRLRIEVADLFAATGLAA